MANKKNNKNSDILLKDPKKIIYHSDDDDDSKGKKIFNIVFISISALLVFVILLIYIVRYFDAYNNRDSYSGIDIVEII